MIYISVKRGSGVIYNDSLTISLYYLYFFLCQFIVIRGAINSIILYNPQTIILIYIALDLDNDLSCYDRKCLCCFFHCDFNLLTPPPSKLFQDGKRLEEQVAERTLCIQVFPSHPHFTVRNLAKEFINFTTSHPVGTKQVK